MRLFLVIFLSIFSTLTILSLAFVLYEHDGQLRQYKRALFGMREDYAKLEKDYETYQAKVKNLRQVTVLATSGSSKSMLVNGIINRHAASVSGELSIYFKNLSTGESVIVDGERTYHMASLYKVILTIYILEKVKESEIVLTDRVSDGDITIEEALNKIITESNNEYALDLAHQYGWENIEAAMKEKLGIDFTFTDKLEANIKNIGALFEDIALSLKISDLESEYLLKLLNEQTRTGKLPKYLPKNVLSHNKTGELDGYSHDAAIFYTPKANYVLVFMSNTPNPAGTDEQMAQMSKEIYEVLNGSSLTNPTESSPSGVLTTL